MPCHLIIKYFVLVILCFSCGGAFAQERIAYHDLFSDFRSFLKARDIYDFDYLHRTHNELGYSHQTASLALRARFDLSDSTDHKHLAVKIFYPELLQIISDEGSHHALIYGKYEEFRPSCLDKKQNPNIDSNDYHDHHFKIENGYFEYTYATYNKELNKWHFHDIKSENEDKWKDLYVKYFEQDHPLEERLTRDFESYMAKIFYGDTQLKKSKYQYMPASIRAEDIPSMFYDVIPHFEIYHFVKYISQISYHDQAVNSMVNFDFYVSYSKLHFDDNKSMKSLMEFYRTNYGNVNIKEVNNMLIIKCNSTAHGVFDDKTNKWKFLFSLHDEAIYKHIDSIFSLYKFPDFEKPSTKYAMYSSRLKRPYRIKKLFEAN